MKAIRLRTEYLKNPIGIDFDHPRLFWNCSGGITQTAYRIKTEKWDSGKVVSSSMHAVYMPDLSERERVTWQVCLYDENDEEGEWSEPAFFETGIHSWQAKWITGSYKVNPKERYPADCFRKSFTLDEDVKTARLYITACGLYEARINGIKAGNFCMAPGLTDYNKRIQYQTFDVSAALKKGVNEITVQLADGWYRGSVGAWGIRNAYGKETKLLAQLEVMDSCGKKTVISSDHTWNWSNDGPIRFADNKDGEIVEAYRIPSYCFEAKETSHHLIPVCSNNVPVTMHERFHPVITKAPNGKMLLDFKQNLSGMIHFTIDAHKGEKIIIRCGEMLDEEGNLTLKNIQLSAGKKTTPLQKVEYICKEGRNDYTMTFSVFGFRYAEVESELNLCAENIEAAAVYSDFEETGFFTCSNPLINQLVACTKWSAKSNSLDIPTDCPTRERHGWSGDAQIFFETAAYLFDYASFSKKYLNDLYDWQKKDGCLPQIAPYGGVDFYMSRMNGSVGWSDAGILIPYRFSKIYGDNEILEEYYERMKKYAGFMIHRCGKNGLLSKPLHLKGEAKKYAVNAGQSYGEWAEPADVYPNDWKDMAAAHPEVSTAYTAYVMNCMAEIAEILEKDEDAAEYRHIAEGCRLAYQAMARREEFTLDTDRQARLVRPLAFNLLDEKQTTFAKKRLLEALDHYGWRLGTGFLSTPLILDVLAQYDIEAAYRLLENEKMPGWLFMPKNGATTIWESWEGTKAQGGIASLNHYSKGAVCAWLFTDMCGIRPDGENHFVIAPKPGGHITHASAEYQSIYGKVSSSWEREDDHIIFTVTIPANTSAKIVLPDSTSRFVKAGTYTYRSSEKMQHA